MGAFAFADVSASASLSFEFGDPDLRDTTPNLPAFSYAQAATATLGLASGDEKVVATATLNLLAPVSATTEMDAVEDTVNYYDAIYEQGTTDVLENQLGGLVATNWAKLQGVIDWWNEDDVRGNAVWGAYKYFAFSSTRSDDDITADTTAFSAAVLAKSIDNALAYDTDDTALEAFEKYDLVEEFDSPTITLKDLVEEIEEAAEEFDFVGIGNTTDEIGDTYYAVVSESGAETPLTDITGALVAQMDADIDAYLEVALTSDIDGTATGVQNLYDSQVTAWTSGNFISRMESYGASTFQYLTAAERAALVNVADLVLSYNIAVGGGPSDPDTYTTTIVQNFISSVTLSFMGVGGVVDVTCYFGGQHVTAGAFSLDMVGHQDPDDNTGAYPALKLALSNGVVPGLSAGLTFYTDITDMQDAVDVADDWYTWIDESALEDEDLVDPVYGLKIDGGYMADLGDMSAGATFAFGMYDLLGDDTSMGFSVMPSFYGMGANIGVCFDYAVLMKLMKLGVTADYTIMGITPNVYFRMFTNNGADGYYTVYGDASSVADVVKTDDDGGMELGGGVSANLADLLPLAVTISGGLDYAMPTNDDNYYAWNAGLSVVPMDAVTISFGANGDSFIGNGFLFNAGVNYVYSIANIYFKLFNSWDADNEERYLGYTLGTSVSF